MMAVIFLLTALTATWWGVVWLVIPIDLAALALPSLVSLHVAPPVLAVLLVLFGKQAWKWNAARKKKARENEQAAQKEAERTAKAVQRGALPAHGQPLAGPLGPVQPQGA